MAAAATKKQQNPPVASATATTVVDPKFEWAEKAGSYVLRLPLPGFRKDDFKVQVDGAGRLTVSGTRPGAAGPGSLCKVFQLPATASTDDITGRIEAGVLTLTVPKRAPASAGAGAAPTSIEEIKRKQPSVTKEENKVAGVTKPEPEKETPKDKEDASGKSMDEATNKAQPKRLEEEKEAKSPKQEHQKPAPAPKKEEVKPKEPQAAFSLGFFVSQRLTDMKWADGMVEAARNNKEVVAVGVAAFSLGFLVSQRLFRK